MTNFKKTLLGVAAAMALAAPVANASPITVGGVTWDPDSTLDFSSFSIAIRQFIDGTSGVVSGFGFISTMNGTSQAEFCPSCELTFQFGNFTPISGGVLPNAVGQSINYAGGFVKVFVDDSPEITNPSNPTTLTFANTGDGDLWLDMVGHTLADGSSFTGSVLGIGTNITSLQGGGVLDVIGGLAQGNFNTNTQTDGADFTFSNSFTLFFPSSPKNLLDSAGTGNFFSDSTIPEPGSLALLGIGLLGLGGMSASRKRAKA